MLKPYIGITDFMTYDQVLRMHRVYLEYRKAGSERQLHVGVMMSCKTLRGLPSRFTKAFPLKGEIKSIFGRPLEGAYHCLHYADYSDLTDFNDVVLALQFAGPYASAIQFDMPWPNLGIVANPLAVHHYHIEVILQIGQMALSLEGFDPNKVVRRLAEYQGHIDRVLLDQSMGKGEPMKADVLLPYLRAIRKAYPHLGLVVAGGLGPNSLDLVRPILDEFPDVSIDAQGKLRPSTNSLDPIDWDMAGSYLAQGLKLLS